MTNTIHEYHPTYQKGIEIFCNEFYNKSKSRRLFNAVLHQGKRWWTYGVAAIVAHALSGHGRGDASNSNGIGRFFHSPSISTTQTLMVELTLWTAGFGIAWCTWLSHVYLSQVKDRTKKWLHDMDRVRSEPKSNVWLLMDNNNNKSATEENGRVLGIALFTCDPSSEEGQIQVAALGPRLELALVENAIQFARQQDIKVITQDHKKNTLDVFF
ncbi:hypothetical protein BCR42DRAFT_425887 [Absidia repens]|uniref:Uncharacterized protein n=1 Tax=Absidia repens TaxID=90262 RepID=A0A1X2I3H5_9FUNG|nr:hypothetical protein BCR42DRAFT_425887 [Absidia repens]